MTIKESNNKYILFQILTCYLPARYIFGVMAMLGVMVAYIMRACLSIAITQMVVYVQHNETKSSVDEEMCPASDYVSSSPYFRKGGDFEWSEKTQGIILSSFYYGYIITHIPGGLLAQKFGGKHTLGFGILSTAVFTLITPWAAHQGALCLIIIRFLEGVGEGVTFPSLCTMLAQWAPPTERSTLTTAAFTGVQIGTVMANLIGGIILEYVPGGWIAVFYIFGGISIVWFLLWTILCYNDPSSHPYISEKEKLYLKETIGETERKKDLGPMPWKAILTSKPVWALVIGEVGHDWGLYTMVTDLPKYMSDVLKFNPAQNGLRSSLPYFATWVSSLLTSALADWILKKEYCSYTFIRKVFATLGAIGPAVGVIAASYVGCDRVMVTVLFTIGMGFMGFCYCSLRVNALDLSPNYSGTIMAFVNGAGCLSGMLTPFFTGLLTPNKNVDYSFSKGDEHPKYEKYKQEDKESPRLSRSIKEWRVVFWIMVVILLGSNFVFVFFGSGDLQEWNDPYQDSESGKNPKKHPPQIKENNVSENGGQHYKL